MRYKRLSCCLGLIVTILFVGALALATDSHQGKVVKAGEGKLTMTDSAGKNEHTHNVAADATITRNGKACELTALQEGDTVTVTTEKKEDELVVTKIEAEGAGS